MSKRTDPIDASKLPALDSYAASTLLVPAVVAAYLGISVGTLDKWRRPTDGRPTRGPRYRRLGDGPKARVRYEAGDVRAYIEAGLYETDETIRQRARLGEGVGTEAA